MNAKQNLVLSGADDVCVYSIHGGNSQQQHPKKIEKNSSKNAVAQLTCWNSSEVTAIEWIDNDNFIIGELSGMITIDKANQDYFRQVSTYYSLTYLHYTLAYLIMSMHVYSCFFSICPTLHAHFSPC